MKEAQTKRKTMKRRNTRGGAQRRPECPYSTEKDQNIRNLWNSTIRHLQNKFDSNYRGEFHVHGGINSCNLWIWKHCETLDGYSDNHIDVYWLDYDRYKLGITATRNGRHVGGRQVFDMRYASSYSQDDFAYEIASKIDTIYDNLLYCAKYDYTWALAGSYLPGIDRFYKYQFDCNTMDYWKTNYPNYVVNVQWSNDNVRSFKLIFTFYSGKNKIGSDTYNLNSIKFLFCNYAFFNEMAKVLDEMYNNYF